MERVGGTVGFCLKFLGECGKFESAKRVFFEICPAHLPGQEQCFAAFKSDNGRA